MLTWLTTIETAALALAAMQPAGRATTYVIDPDLSHVQLHVGKTGLVSFAGHTHEIVARVAEGRVEIDRGDLARSSVHIAFDASALRVTGDGEPAEDVPEVQRTMESDRVFDVSRFPRITFESPPEATIRRRRRFVDEGAHTNCSTRIPVKATERPIRTEARVLCITVLRQHLVVTPASLER